MNDLKTNLTIDVMKAWEEEFPKIIHKKSRSTKIKFNINDALARTQFHTKRDECFIIAFEYLKKYQPENNHLIVFLTHYSETGKKLKEKYFKYNPEILYKYYQKVEEKRKIEELYNPFNIKAYRNYLIFMVLKLYNVYESTDDELFNVSIIDSREYNPIVKIPSVLRSFLPFRIIEYDIKRAFPSFIDIELGATNYRHSIYDILDKKLFAKVLNANSDKDNLDYYYQCLEELEKVYGNRSSEVLTMSRFSNKGNAFRDFTVYEKKYIERFVKENSLNNFVRLHDAIFVLESQTVNKTTFDTVEFGRKEVNLPEEKLDVKELFYFIDEKGYFKTTPSLCRNFLVQSGVKRITTADDKIELTRNNGNVVEFLNTKTSLLSIFKEGIIEVKNNFSLVENLIAHEYKNIILKALPLIEPQKLKFYRDSQFTFALPFKNGLMMMNENGDVNTQEYNSDIGFFYKHNIHKHMFTQTNEIGDYEKFIRNIGGNNFEILRIIIGYLAHSYKDPSNSPAIVLSDEGADGTKRNGGRGKSLVFEALKQVLKTMLKGGQEFNPDYTFVFDDLDDGTRVYCIDDVGAGFKYDSLYTNILGGINRHRKGRKAEMLEFNESPKFLITTNWLIPYSADENSTNRRFIEFKVNNHYNSDHNPVKEFGKRFFVDWDCNEWNKFYSFIFKCVKLYFDKGLMKPIYDKNVDNYNVKFNNQIVLNEFERILNTLLQRKQPFNVTDFYNIYQDYQNPLKNDKLFNHKNIRDYIDVWFCYSIKKRNDDLKNWSYYKSSKKWIYENNNREFKSTKKLDLSELMKVFGVQISPSVNNN